MLKQALVRASAGALRLAVRNEKRINARREAFDKTARKPKYKEGDYVLKKNLSPA